MGSWVGGENGRLERVIDLAYGQKVFDEALAFCTEVDGASDGRLSAILAPKRVETCTREQLEATEKLATDLGYPVCIHAAYNTHEFYDLTRAELMTPIEYLEDVGLLALRPLPNIGHGNFVAEHRKTAYSGGRDISLMGGCGCTVSHCPINLARRARFLDSWKTYWNAGVNVALGTDTFPRDMIMQMRSASMIGKIMADDLTSATAAQVFEAATVNGAKSLGRTDLGRLEIGAKADIITIRLADENSLRHGPVRDPIKSLVDTGIGDDVDTVIVGGHTIMEGGQIPGVNYRELQLAGQRMGTYIWRNWTQWDTLGRDADAMSPLSFPME